MSTTSVPTTSVPADLRRDLSYVAYRALFVSVNRTLPPLLPMPSLDDMRKSVSGHWACTAKHAAKCDLVIAVFRGKPVAAWRLVDAHPASDAQETYGPYDRRRTTLVLGEPVALLVDSGSVPSLRSGIAAGVVSLPYPV